MITIIEEFNNFKSQIDHTIKIINDSIIIIR